MEDIQLEKYGFSETMGFIMKKPLEKLPSYFSAWEELVSKLDWLRSNPTESISCAISGLPLLDHSVLNGERELRLAHLLLSCLGMSYVHEHPENPASSLPPQIAIPWVGVSRRLGLPPIIIHASVSLCNWRKIDPKGPMTLNNLTLLYSLDKTRDLEVFFLVPLLVELAGIPAVLAIVKGHAAVKVKDSEALCQCLVTIQNCLINMKETLGYISPGCSPEVFYNIHRPLLSGWRDNPCFANGLVYEGVSAKPLMYSGGSAAQSACIQLIDAGLGIFHKGTEGEFLRRMLDYMPPCQRDLILDIGKGPSIRDFCQVVGGKAQAEYNLCLEELEKFRTSHLVMVFRYITTPSNRDGIRMEHLAKQGTGGTPLATFLKTIRSNVSSSKIQN